MLSYWRKTKTGVETCVVSYVLSGVQTEPFAWITAASRTLGAELYWSLLKPVIGAKLSQVRLSLIPLLSTRSSHLCSVKLLVSLNLILLLFPSSSHLYSPCLSMLFMMWFVVFSVLTKLLGWNYWVSPVNKLAIVSNGKSHWSIRLYSFMLRLGLKFRLTLLV